MEKIKNNDNPSELGIGVNDSRLRAGVAKSDITTGEKGRIIKDPLYAKVLVLNDGITKITLITMDTTAIGGRRISQGMLPDVGEDFMPMLRARIEKELGIPGLNVLVNASHTHPPGRFLCEDKELLDRVFDAVRRASQSMVEVKTGAGSGYEDRISMNRTLRLKNGSHWTIRHSNPCPPDDEVEALGPLDPEIGIIRIDRLDGSPFAVVYNFACHPLWGDYEGRITANFPGYASKVIEDSLGHEAMAFFLQGAAGDVCDVTFKNFERVRDVECLGTTLGLSTLKALSRIETKDAKIKVMSETIMLPRRTDIPEKIEKLEKEQSELLASLRSTSLNFKSFLPLFMKYKLNHDYPSDYAFNYLKSEKTERLELVAMDSFNRGNVDKYLRNIQAMEILARIQDDIATLRKHQAINEESGTSVIEAEVMGIKIGECALISAPLEALVEIGLNIKKASPLKHTFMAAYSNGYMHYGAPASYYDKGGYEVTECLLAPEWQEIYERKAKKIILKLK